MRQSFTPRERTEELERVNLSVRASLALDTKGRDRYEDPDAVRTVYQQDRERIAASPAFRRLAATSIGLPLPGSILAALTQTLEIAQTSRALARALRLNEDLVEAIALGRHLGQPPFGAAGRVALDGIAHAEFLPGEQAVRIVEQAGGLNLTFETRDGLLHHDDLGAATLEAQLVTAVGRFHELSAELDVALSSGLVPAAEVPTAVRILGSIHAQRLASLVDDVLEASQDDPCPAGGARLAAAYDDLVQWRRERLEEHPEVLAAAQRAVHCLRSIAVHESLTSSPVEVVDTICSLTDRQARERFDALFLPGPQPG